MMESRIYRTGIRGAIALANRLAKARDKDEALRMAVFEDDLEWVERLLGEGADINAAKGEYKTTVLMEAAVRGNQGVMRLLLEKGANVNMADQDGWTALMGATVQGLVEPVKLLLENGADVSAKNHNGETALVMATGLKHTEIRDALLEHDAER
jgi:ankyrin repeat protein